MKKLTKILIMTMCLVAFSVLPAMACTSYYAGSDCTADGTTLYGRTEDISSAADKVFKVIPAKKVGKNAMYTDESGATDFSAPIKLTTTYRYTVVRDCEGAEDGYFGEVGQNEKGVSMSGTTSSSPSKTARNADPFVGKGITEENLVDYILCQASSAEDGVKILLNVVETIGAGEGNGLFIADDKEVWYVEILTGHNMCAIKMPSDKAAIIPNCFMIGEVDLADTENVIASENLITLAKENDFFVDVEKVAPLSSTAAEEQTEEPVVSAEAEETSEETAEAPAVDTEETSEETAEAPAVDTEDEPVAAEAGDAGDAGDAGTTINVKASYAPGYTAGNADRIRGGQYLLSGKDTNEYSTAKYKDMFFDCDDVTVEKLYELAGYRYEGMDFGTVSRYIGVSSSVECHIMQITKNAPKELATVQWLAMCNADFSTFVPFYTALMTDTSDIYKLEAYKHTTDAAYWVYRDIGTYGAMDRTKVGAPIKATWKNYMLKMEELQKTVNQQMIEAYGKSSKANMEIVATNLGKAIGEETYGYAKTLLNELAKWMAACDGSPSSSRKAFTTTVKFDDLVYDISLADTYNDTYVVSTDSLKGKKLKVSIAKTDDSKTGYQIAYSTDKNFAKKYTKYCKTKSAVKTFKKLKKGKTYYVKVRTYKKVSGKYVYGAWSATKVTDSIKK